MSESVRQQDLSAPSTTFEYLRIAQFVIQQEAAALQRFSERLPIELAEAVDLIASCRGAVIVTGIGKAGWIGQKISASFASTGTRSHFLHPSEAFHGDFGRIGPEDIVLVLSNSGETGEILRMLPTIEKMKVPLIALTAVENSSLAKCSQLTIAYGRVSEACALGLAPTTTTSLMLAAGDALALALSQKKGFTSIDFARYHPGGSLGRKLQQVEEAMRPLADCRSATETTITRQAIANQPQEHRRPGAILVTSDTGQLSGIFTDSDLVKLLEKKRDHLLDRPLAEIMTPSPKTIQSGQYVSDALKLLSQHSISELPVVDDAGRPQGILDITDLI